MCDLSQIYFCLYYKKKKKPNTDGERMYSDKQSTKFKLLVLLKLLITSKCYVDKLVTPFYIFSGRKRFTYSRVTDRLSEVWQRFVQGYYFQKPESTQRGIFPGANSTFQIGHFLLLGVNSIAAVQSGRLVIYLAVGKSEL